MSWLISLICIGLVELRGAEAITIALRIWFDGIQLRVNYMHNYIVVYAVIEHVLKLIRVLKRLLQYVYNICIILLLTTVGYFWSLTSIITQMYYKIKVLDSCVFKMQIANIYMYLYFQASGSTKHGRMVEATKMPLTVHCDIIRHDRYDNILFTYDTLCRIARAQ